MIRKLLWPAIMTTVMLVVLLGLGTWQVQRLAWKTRILAQIAACRGGAAGAAAARGGHPSPFTKVAVTGALMHDLSALYGAEVRDTRAGPEMGAQLIEPLERDGAPPLLVDRGWVPLKRRSPIGDAAGRRSPSPAMCTPPNMPGLFSARDDVPGAALLHARPGGDRRRARPADRSRRSSWWRWARRRPDAAGPSTRRSICRDRPTTICHTRSPGMAWRGRWW